MNKFQIFAFFRAFPFLTSGEKPLVPDQGNVEEVRVARIGVDFLDRRPRYEGATGSLVDIDDSETIWLFSAEGKPLGEVKQERFVRHNEAHQDDEQSPGEAVGEALLRIGPDLVHYAVVIHRGYQIQDHYSVGGYCVTVYKPPKGFTLAGWVEEKIRRAEEFTAAAIAEIDGEA